MKPMSPRSFRVSISRLLGGCLLAGLFAFSLLSPKAIGQPSGSGSVTGTVSDGSGYYISGAEVRVAGTSLTTVTDRAGQFRIDGVAAGQQRVTVDYLGSQTVSNDVTVSTGATVDTRFTLKSEVVVLDTYKVESVREGQSRAINQQRASNTISNIISSDAIGNLPDRTVGEALGRLPGVNVVDDSYASIRGTAAQYNAVTLDGDRFSPGGNSIQDTQVSKDTRAADLSMIPAEMVGSIEVIKALTADKEADSFGGTINLTTRSAFELKKRSINGNASYIYNDYRGRSGYAGSLTYMDVLNKARTFGIAATLTYRNEDRASDKYEINYYPNGQIPVGTGNVVGPISAVGDQAMEQLDARLNLSTIEKLGATVNLDWKPVANTELHLRTFYEGSDTDQTRYRNRARALSRWNATSTAELESGNQVRLTNTLEESTIKQDVVRIGIDGKTTLPFGTLEYGLRYGDSSASTDLQRYIFDFPSNTERRRYSWKLDRSNPLLPVLSITNIATGSNGLYYNLADRRLFSIRFQDATEDESNWSSNVDYAFNLNAGKQRIDFKVGAKYRGKDRQSRPNIHDYTPLSTTASNTYLYPQFTIIAEPKDILQGSMATMGPYVSLSEVLNTYYTNPSTYAASSNEDSIMLDARKYDVSEDIYAGYAMATTKFGKLEIIGGVRWEQTKTSYTWLADPAGPSNGSKSYGDPYPSLLLNYRVTKNLVARAAYTCTLARPSYGDLIPYSVKADTEVDSGTGGLDPSDYPQINKIYLGNADLKAQQSQNYDLSIEYYFKTSGILSAAYFHKDLSDIIYRSQWVDPATPTTIYFQDRNGSTGKVDGLELTAQVAFTFLPGFLNGFGINANATFTKGSSKLSELIPGSSPSAYREYDVNFLPEQPKRVYNVQLWWEKYGFTARIAMAYVGEFVRTSGGLTNMSINNDSMRWDASLSYRLTKNFTLYVEGRNLSNEVTSWYAGTPDRPESYSYPGASFTGGVKFRF